MARDYAKSFSPPRRQQPRRLAPAFLLMVLMAGLVIGYYCLPQRAPKASAAPALPVTKTATEAPPAVNETEEDKDGHFDFYKLLAENTISAMEHPSDTRTKPKAANPQVNPVGLSLYVLELAKWGSYAEAQAHYQMLTAQGLDVSLRACPSGSCYQVILGPFASEIGANITRASLEAQHGTQARVVPHR